MVLALRGEHWHWRALQVDKAELDEETSSPRRYAYKYAPALKNTSMMTSVNKHLEPHVKKHDSTRKVRVLINTWNSVLKNTIPHEQY